MSAFRKLFKDEDGAAIIYFLIALPAFLGLSLLAIDIGRGNNLYFDLQKSVDSLALTAAAELDGAPDAIIRADARLTGELKNNTRFNDGASVILDSGSGNISWRYLSGLPANDDDPIPTTFNTTDPAAAQFIEVKVSPAQPYSSVFPLSFITSTRTVGITATAVAGYGSAVCDFTPLFICNPVEPTPDPYCGSDEDTYVPEEGLTMRTIMDEGRMIVLRQQGGGDSQAFPGNFGFLQIPTGNKGAAEIRDAIASTKPKTCYSSRTVETKPGFAATITDAINVRFDMFNGAMNSETKNPDYPAARNVRKGYEPPNGKGQKCPNTDPGTNPDELMGLPRDKTMTDTQGGEIGQGNWDCAKYWEVNFSNSGQAKPADCTADSTMTRYEMYKYELANGLVSTKSLGGENGTPTCNLQDVNSTLDRRLIYAAVINCKAAQQADTNCKLSGQQTLRPVNFISIFLTEALEKGGTGNGNNNKNYVYDADAADSTPDQSIRGEIVDITGPDGDGSLDRFMREEPQLYR